MVARYSTDECTTQEHPKGNYMRIDDVADIVQEYAEHKAYCGTGYGKSCNCGLKELFNDLGIKR